MKKHPLLALILCLSLHSYGQKTHQLLSPDGKIQVSIGLSDKIYYDVTCQQDTLLNQCNLQLEIGKDRKSVV